VTGGAEGTVTYTWLDGGHFLLQNVDLTQDGQPVRGLEVIGHERKFGAEPSTDIRTRYYSPAYFRGEFTADGDTLEGAWVYPGGGGYESTMRRQRP
jgi:hypothetical protein